MKQTAKLTPGKWEVTPLTPTNVKTPDGMISVSWSSTDGSQNERAEVAANLIAAAPELLEALTDMLSGWKYIREAHGDLYGVGWERAQKKAESALARTTGRREA